MKAWAWALLVSVALHVALLGLFPSSRTRTPPEGERVAGGPRELTFTRVGLLARSAPAPASPAAPTPSTPPRTASRPGHEPVAGGELPLAAPSEPTGEPVAAEEGHDDAQGEGGEGGASPDAASDGGAMGVVSLAPSAPAGEAREVDLTALMHARLAAVADGCYPPAAKRFRQRGTVQLSFCADASGAASATRVVESSGAALLDAAARGCVLEKAAPFPAEAGGRCFTVPVRFGGQ